MTAILAWLGGKLAGALAMGCALLLGCGLIWQTGRIDGWPLVGGGFKAQIAGLQQQQATRDLAAAQAQSAALMARAKLADAAEAQASAHAASDQAMQTQTRIIIERIPHYVSAKSDGECVVPVGAVRLLDAAASGADVDDAAAAIAPGQPDDAASGIPLSDVVALLSKNLGRARQNADQLTHLEKAVGP
jgi:hypothetical protein